MARSAAVLPLWRLYLRLRRYLRSRHFTSTFRFTFLRTLPRSRSITSSLAWRSISIRRAMADSLAAKEALSAAKNIQALASAVSSPPDEGYPSSTQHVVATSILKGTRGYIERVANQVNGCYERGWFDSCAVMIRRLIE